MEPLIEENSLVHEIGSRNRGREFLEMVSSSGALTSSPLGNFLMLSLALDCHTQMVTFPLRQGHNAVVSLNFASYFSLGSPFSGRRIRSNSLLRNSMAKELEGDEHKKPLAHSWSE